jgi:hypothetical protein
METIKVNIKNVVKKNLNEARINHIHESFKSLKNEKDGAKLFRNYIQISNQLLDEGYEYKEIKHYLNEFENPLNPSNWGLDTKKVGQGIENSVWSEAKEFLIKWICNAFGFNPTFSTILAQTFADLDPRDMIRPFKDMSSCTSSAPKLVDAILEVVVRQIGGSVTGTNSNNYGWSGVGSGLIGNMFGEAIRESNIGETIAGKFCKAIH